MHSIVVVAKALSELKDKMVFVGGAIVELYADIVSDEKVRETFEIDITCLEVASYSQYNHLLKRLSELGFHPDPESNIICRFRYKDFRLFMKR